MFLRFTDFGTSEYGQDLAEYCLITALIALIGLGMFYKLSGGVQGLWGTAGSAIGAANASAAGGSTSQGSGPVDH